MREIVHIVSNKAWGGGEQYVLDLATRQKADGIDVTVVCKPVASIRRKYEEAGVRVLAMPLGGVLDVRSAVSLARVIRQSASRHPSPQTAIHAHNFKDAFTACYARRLSGCKEVRVVMCRHLTRKGKDSLPYRWLYRQLDCLCFDSRLSETTFLSTRPAIDERKLRIVHTSVIVPSDVQPVDVRRRYAIPAGAVIAMFHGRLDPEKGLDTLLEAVKLVNEGQLGSTGSATAPSAEGDDRTPGLRLILVGRGSDEYTAHLKQKAAELCISDKVFFAGFVTSVLPWTASADVGILASTVSEGCPLSPQEYMSQGHPVIVTDNGGQREYVTDGSNGLLVPPGDAKALAAALGRLIADGDLRQRLGKQARADFYDHLSYDHFYSKIMEIYDS